MKKTFEFILVLIIFYGVFAAFEKAAIIVSDEPKTIWIALFSLIAAALLLVVYNVIISSELKSNLNTDINSLKENIKEKEIEVKQAQSFKETLIHEAEESKPRE